MPRFGRAIFGYKREAVDAAALDMERRFAQLEQSMATRAEDAASRLAETEHEAHAVEERLNAARQRQDVLLATLQRIQERGAVVTSQALGGVDAEERAWQERAQARRADLDRLKALWSAAAEDVEGVVALYRFLVTGDVSGRRAGEAQHAPVPLRTPQAGG